MNNIQKINKLLKKLAVDNPMFSFFESGPEDEKQDNSPEYQAKLKEFNDDVNYLKENYEYRAINGYKAVIELPLPADNIIEMIDHELNAESIFINYKLTDSTIIVYLLRPILDSKKLTDLKSLAEEQKYVDALISGIHNELEQNESEY